MIKKSDTAKIQSSDQSLDIQLCPSQDLCSGCQYLGVPYGEQLKLKANKLNHLFENAGVITASEIQMIPAGSSELRDRLDFTLEDGRWGLYQKNKREILDIKLCSQLSRPLQDWLTDFRQFKFPFKKGSARLRVNAEGRRGLWLDFSNIDIKSLLEEKNLIQSLQKVAFVEIGQRRKVPTWNGAEFKLKDSQTHSWFNTWVGETKIPLYCQVASFTQPSLKANKLIAQTIQQWISELNISTMIEFGSGIGNLTIPAAAAIKEKIIACELDKGALAGFSKTLENLPLPLLDLAKKIEIRAGDFQRKIKNDFSGIDGVMVNPPRSGLLKFIDPLADLKKAERPNYFLYMSCYPESMAQDVLRLQKLGYRLQKMTIVDQFPQTEHFEVLGLLKKSP